MLKECLFKLSGLSRYAAHCEIDRSLPTLKRESPRRWHAVILDVGSEVVAGCIRTSSAAVTESISALWVDVPVCPLGQSFEGILQFVPSKPLAFNRFRNDDGFAMHACESRLRTTGAFSDDSLKIQLISNTRIAIDKKSCSYTAPSAWFSISGVVQSQQALELLMLDGIGGSRAFGVGKLIGKTSFLFSIANSVAGPVGADLSDFARESA